MKNIWYRYKFTIKSDTESIQIFLRFWFFTVETSADMVTKHSNTNCSRTSYCGFRDINEIYQAFGSFPNCAFQLNSFINTIKKPEIVACDSINIQQSDESLSPFHYHAQEAWTFKVYNLFQSSSRVKKQFCDIF